MTSSARHSATGVVVARWDNLPTIGARSEWTRLSHEPRWVGPPEGGRFGRNRAEHDRLTLANRRARMLSGPPKPSFSRHYTLTQAIPRRSSLHIADASPMCCDAAASETTSTPGHHYWTPRSWTTGTKRLDGPRSSAKPGVENRVVTNDSREHSTP